jgi:glutamyl-tRNA reductase
MIDIAQPRDGEEGAEAIDGVQLFTIDNLRTINEQTMNNRKAEAERARQFIEDELVLFLRQLNRKTADDILASLHSWAEAVRTRERDRAIARLGCSDERTAGVVDDLTRVLAKKLLTDATFAIRASAELGDLEAAESLLRAITQGERLSCDPHASRKK